MIYLFCYLVIGVIAAVMMVIVVYDKKDRALLVATCLFSLIAWPFIIAMYIEMKLVQIKKATLSRRCAYCDMVFDDVNATREHVQKCIANPLVQRIIELEIEVLNLERMKRDDGTIKEWPRYVTHTH